MKATIYSSHLNLSRLVLFLLGLSMTQCQTKKGPLPLTIPFQLTSHNNISIQAVLNQTDTVDLMFHTAASSVTLTTAAIERLQQVQWDTEEEVNSWGGNGSARYSKSNELAISTLQWDSLAIWETTNAGPTTDGKFGPNLFEDYIIEIDFDKNILVLHETLPKKAEGFVKVALLLEDDFFFLQGKGSLKEGSYENKFLIHSGYGGTILLDDKFVADHQLGAQIEIIDEKELKDSYGNVLTTKKGKLPVFTLGEETFEDIPVGFFEGRIGRQQMSVIGGDLLKRFNLIIDKDKKQLYLKPNQLRDAIFAEF